MLRTQEGTIAPGAKGFWSPSANTAGVHSPTFWRPRLVVTRLLLPIAAASLLAVLVGTIASETSSVLIGLVGAGLALLLGISLYTALLPRGRSPASR